MTRSSLFIGLMAFVFAGALSFGTAVLSAMLIERRSVEAVDTALLEEGQDWAIVSADGLQVFLSGIAPDEAASARAITRAGAVIDANRVVNQIEVAIADVAGPPRFSLDMLRNGDGVQLIGLIPASTGSAIVDEAIANFAEGMEVTDMVEVADYPAPSTWDAALAYGLRALDELPRSKVTVFADRVEVEGISESTEQRAAFIDTLQRRMPSGVEIVLDISAPRPVITPFVFRAARDFDGIQLETCTADTEEAQERILTALAGANVGGISECDVGLGAPTSRWATAVEAGLTALGALNHGGSFAISDADVTLVTAEGTTQDEFDAVIGELQAALPDLFSLQGVFLEPTGTGDTGPSRFIATLDPATGVSLRGRLPPGPMGQSVQTFAIAAFGRARTDIATREVDELPADWSIRTMAGLMALSELHEGRLTVEPGNLIVEGRSGVSSVASDITQLLSQELGAGASFDVDVTYDVALDPIASLPDPETCVARIQAVQDDGKIVFEPGSVEITDDAGEILDQITELLPACQHVAMEIGGHTDSQGREEMNLGLSQSRADAVLNGLLARDVLVSNLTARGYGETQPIGDNETEAGRELNRRIEFRLYSDVEVELAEAAAEEALRYPYETRPTPRPDSVLEAAAAAAEDTDDTDQEE